MRQHEGPEDGRLLSGRAGPQQEGLPVDRRPGLLREPLHGALLQEQRPGHRLQEAAAAVAREEPAGPGLPHLPARLHAMMVHSFISNNPLKLFSPDE